MLKTNLKLARTLALMTALTPAVVQGQDHAATSSATLSSEGAPDNTAEIASRGVIIIHEFCASDRTGWPYDIKQLQSQTVAELRAKAEGRFDVSVGAPATPRMHTYTLQGEIVSWRPGNRAKRLIVGM